MLKAVSEDRAKKIIRLHLSFVAEEEREYSSLGAHLCAGTLEIEVALGYSEY
jgi:hypothetical protein